MKQIMKSQQLKKAKASEDAAVVEDEVAEEGTEAPAATLEEPVAEDGQASDEEKHQTEA